MVTLEALEEEGLVVLDEPLREDLPCRDNKIRSIGQLRVHPDSLELNIEYPLDILPRYTIGVHGHINPFSRTEFDGVLFHELRQSNTFKKYYSPETIWVMLPREYLQGHLNIQNKSDKLFYSPTDEICMIGQANSDTNVPVDGTVELYDMDGTCEYMDSIDYAELDFHALPDRFVAKWLRSAYPTEILSRYI